MTAAKSSTAEDLSDLLRTLRPRRAAPTADAAVAEAATAEPVESPVRPSTPLPSDHLATSKTTPRRALGKRSDPDYRLTGVYLPRSLTDDVRRALIGARDLDLSELVEQLLTEWLRTHISTGFTNRQR